MKKRLYRTRSLAIFLAIIVSVWPSLTFAQSSSVDSKKALEGFEAQVEQAMRELHVPGVAVGIIQNDKIIFTKGYGVREIGKAPPVTADTLFAIGSMTKSFTTSVMATLVDAGKLNWDKPVRDYLPWFQLYGPIATQLVTPRDLTTHRTGLPRHDFIRFSTFQRREELVRGLRYLEPNHAFRDTFQYNNLMYVAAGYLAGEIAGTTWEDLVKQRIFVPLGMNSSNTSVEDTQKRDNFALPYLLKNDTDQITSFYNYQKFGIGPNGAVNSTVHDMLKYLQMHLNQGAFGGKQIISAAEIKELHKPVDIEKEMQNYALGWEVEDHRGHLVVGHGGAITGFTSEMIMIPDEKMGIVVLNNLDGSRLPRVLVAELVDRLLGLSPEDYLADVVRREIQQHKTDKEKQKEVETGRISNAHLTLDLDAYTGNYFHPAYGTIHVVQNGDSLAVKFAALELKLKHYNYDWFQISIADADAGSLANQLAQFRVNEHGKVTELLLPLEPAVKPFVFVKQ